MSTLTMDELARTEARRLIRLSFLYLLDMQSAEKVSIAAFRALARENRRGLSDLEEKTFLFRMVINESLSQAKERKENGQEATLHELSTLTPEELSLLSRVLALPAKYRTVVHLQCCEACTPTDLAAILERNENSIHAWIGKAADMLAEDGGFSPPLYASAISHIDIDPGFEGRLLHALSASPQTEQRPRSVGKEKQTVPVSAGRKAAVVGISLAAIAAICVLAAVLIVRAVKSPKDGGATVASSGASLAHTVSEALVASQSNANLTALQAFPETAAGVGITKDAVTLTDVSARDGWMYFGFTCDLEASYGIMLCFVDGYRAYFEKVEYLPEGSAVSNVFFRSYVGFEAPDRKEESLIAVGLNYGAEAGDMLLFYYNWETGKVRLPDEGEDDSLFAVHEALRKEHIAFTRFAIWPESINAVQGHVAFKDLSVIFTEDNTCILNMTVSGLREPLALQAAHPQVTINGHALVFAGMDMPVDIEGSGKTYQEMSTEENLGSFVYHVAEPFIVLPDSFSIDVKYDLFDATTANQRENIPTFSVVGTFTKTNFSVENNG